MPAWTYNLLVVCGPQAAVDDFEGAAKEPALGLDFSFRSLFPAPSAPEMSAEDLRDWTIECYGNKLGSGAAVLCSKRPCLLVYYFLSPWNESNFEGISARFPLLELGVWYYREDGPEAVGVEIVKGGRSVFSAEDEDCSGYAAQWQPYYAAALEELYIRHLAGRVGWADRDAPPPESGRFYRLNPPQRGDHPEEGYRTSYSEELKQLLLAAACRRQSFISPVEELADIWRCVAAYGLEADAAFCGQLAEVMATTRVTRLRDCLSLMDRLQHLVKERTGCELAFTLRDGRGFGFFEGLEPRGFVREALLAELEALEAQVRAATQTRDAHGLTTVAQSHVQAGTVVPWVQRSLEIYRILREQLDAVPTSVPIGTLHWSPVGVWDHEDLAVALNQLGYPLEDALVAMLGRTESGQYSDGWPL